MKVIIYGGISPEHDISVITACLFSSTQFKKIYIDKEGVWRYIDKILTPKEHISAKKLGKKCVLLPNDKRLFVKRGALLFSLGKIDAALLCLHGGEGEGGGVQALLQMCQIPYTSCSALGSSLFQDKWVAKAFLKGLGIPVAQGFLYTYEQFVKKGIPPETVFPAVVKPCTLGSSIAVCKVSNEKELAEALCTVYAYDERALIERTVEFEEEINCAVLDNCGIYELSDIERAGKSGDIFSFEDKYKSKKIMGGLLDKDHDKRAEIYDCCEKIARAADFGGVVRIDFFVEKGNVLVNEVNTIPGTLAFHLFASRYTKKQFLELLVNSALVKQEKYLSFKRFFDTSVLEECPYAKGK